VKNHPIAASIAFLVLAGGVASAAYYGVKGATSNRDAAASESSLRHQLQVAIGLAKMEKFESAQELLAAMIEQHPEVGALWHNYGLVLSATSDLENAERAFDRARMLEPDNWDAVAELANLRRLNGDLDGALDLLDRIPVGAGRLTARLRLDPLWKGIRDDRLAALREKHGVPAETSVRGRQMIERSETLRPPVEASESPPADP
jgi:tetratricopeptide (TPR) repeat protein